MAKETWFTHSVPLVRNIVADNPELGDKELRKVISRAYPYQERKGHAYKSWLRAVKHVIGDGKRRDSVRNMWVKDISN